MNKSDSSCVLPAALQSHYCRWVGDTFTSFTRVIINLKNSCHILKSRHPNIKLTVEYLYHKTLSFIDCNANINQGIHDTSFKEIKHSPALALTATALWVPVSLTTEFHFTIVRRLLLLAHSISLLTIVTSHTFLITLSINIYFFFHRKSNQRQPRKC